MKQRQPGAESSAAQSSSHNVRFSDDCKTKPVPQNSSRSDTKPIPQNSSRSDNSAHLQPSLEQRYKNPPPGYQPDRNNTTYENPVSVYQKSTPTDNRPPAARSNLSLTSAKNDRDASFQMQSLSSNRDNYSVGNVKQIYDNLGYDQRQGESIASSRANVFIDSGETEI